MKEDHFIELDVDKQEPTRFRKLVKQSHRRVAPCFMTGKGCVYSEAIENEIRRRRFASKCVGFLITPFRPNINTFHELSMGRYININYSTSEESLSLLRADQVGRTGYVICNKICKKIQDSDFVLADISADNPNVFYELGLAYGLKHKILVIHHSSSKFGRTIADYIKDDGCNAYIYKNLDPIHRKDFPLSQMLWEYTDEGSRRHDSPHMLMIELSTEPLHGTVLSSTTDIKPEEGDIELDFKTHIRAAISASIEDITASLREDEIPLIATRRNQIRDLRAADSIPSNATFKEIKTQIARAFCVVIRTGGVSCDPMAYFWLGYCHAIGKNVIPVTALDRKGDDLKDLAFDIRALWHMTFYRTLPREIAPEIKDTLHQMIVSDFSEWSRDQFWQEMLQRTGEVSIFTGALHIDQFSREMIGDWDFRTVSELTGYFASHQYPAKIESPVYQVKPESLTSENRERFISELEGLLRNKNCIIIASPDVNPLTEIALGKIYGIPRNEWFTASQSAKAIPGTAIAFKEKYIPESDQPINRGVSFAFYEELIFGGREQKRLRRGFRSSILGGGEVMEEFISQTETTSMKEFTVFAHLLIARNPYCDKEIAPKYIVVLNGISGPATFALTHVLTGGVNKEFVSYGNDFKPMSKAEELVAQINNHLGSLRDPENAAIQYMFKVEVGPRSQETEIRYDPITQETSDWRRVRSWERVQADDGPFRYRR